MDDLWKTGFELPEQPLFEWDEIGFELPEQPFFKWDEIGFEVPELPLFEWDDSYSDLLDVKIEEL